MGKYDQFLAGLPPPVEETPQATPAQAAPEQSFGNTVASAAKGAFTRPAAYLKDLGTNPESMANAMPSLMGTAGGVSPIPGGATGGTAIGQGMRDSALKALGKPVPSVLQHAGELGLSAVGDAFAIPKVKGKIFGSQMGKAEDAAGVVTRGAEKAVTPGSVGQTLRDLEAQIDAGTINTAQGARDAKEIVDQVYKNPHIYEKSPGIEVQAARVNAKVSSLLNGVIPGREAPAKAFAQSQTISNVAKKGWNAIPPTVRRVVLPLLGGDALLRALGGHLKKD